MEYLKKLLLCDPFNYDFINRKKLFFASMIECFEHHFSNCMEYKNWSIKSGISHSSDIKSLEDIPYFPSQIFKKSHLMTTNQIHKRLKSSGTNSVNRSTVYLDKSNSTIQTNVLSKILSSLLGKNRKPFLIIDSNPKNIKDIDLSARYAGMAGYLLASSKNHYLLEKHDNGLKFRLDEFLELIKNYSKKNQPVIVIGYTYMLYEKLLLELRKLNTKIPYYENLSLIHFGGWKKLKDKKISKKKLNILINETLNIRENNIFDIYGFTEQLGTVYPSLGSNGCKVPAYSEVIVRDTNTLRPVHDGNIGFLQFLSPIPWSYPGLSILNDDLGKIVRRNENFIEFEVIGRPDEALPRGCGDTLPENFFSKN